MNKITEGFLIVINIFYIAPLWLFTLTVDMMRLALKTLWVCFERDGHGILLINIIVFLNAPPLPHSRDSVYSLHQMDTQQKNQML